MTDNSIDELTLARLRKQRDEAQAHYDQAPGAFLAAWLKGIKVIGEGWFTYNPQCCEKAPSLDQVCDKWQVIPDYELINQRIGVLSGGEAALLAAMCSFYNAEWGGQLLQDLGIQGLADISAKLDLAENRIVADLLVNYTGW